MLRGGRVLGYHVCHMVLVYKVVYLDVVTSASQCIKSCLEDESTYSYE